MEGFWKFLGEGGKVKILEAKYEQAKQEFPKGRGRGAQNKTFCGGVWIYFLELHIINFY